MSADERRLELALSEPTAATVSALARLEGDLLVLGAGGKMGPSLCRLAVRSLRAAGRDSRVVAVARYTRPELAAELAADGVEPLAADLLDPAALARVPRLPNVIFMAGHKFGTADAPWRAWALNTYLAGRIAEHCRDARIVAFSSGNVYPFWPADGAGPTEEVAPAPVGEYAQSVLGRERMFEFGSSRYGTSVAILRLNYAIEPRYGVLRDVADAVRAGRPVSLAMGRVNVIWQRDANAVALLALAHATSPPLVLNVTGAPAVLVRTLAERFASRFGVTAVLGEPETDTALLADPSRCHALFGPPPVGLDAMIDAVAGWMEAGGRSLGRPTHFEERGGRF